jgi:hypothetical protein
MTPDAQLVDAALRSWKATIDRLDAFFAELSDAQLEQEVAPGRNRLVYLLGHLAAVHDRMLPLLGIGARMHEELDAPFLTSPDRAVASNRSPAELRVRAAWTEVNAALWAGFNRWNAADWVSRHTSVSEEEFAKEPHRNRMSVLLSRTSHAASHHGQVVLTKVGDQQG